MSLVNTSLHQQYRVSMISMIVTYNSSNDNSMTSLFISFRKCVL